jgi:hypothetical protein
MNRMMAVMRMQEKSHSSMNGSSSEFAGILEAVFRTGGQFRLVRASAVTESKPRVLIAAEDPAWYYIRSCPEEQSRSTHGRSFLHPGFQFCSFLVCPEAYLWSHDARAA